MLQIGQPVAILYVLLACSSLAQQVISLFILTYLGEGLSL